MQCESTFMQLVQFAFQDGNHAAGTIFILLIVSGAFIEMTRNLSKIGSCNCKKDKG